MATIQEDEPVEDPPNYGPQDFERIRKIGAGDVGRVYIVRHITTQELYAMKVLSKEEMVKRKKIQRCITERDVLSQVDHPCIVSLYYTFNTANFLYFVMDYCAGGEFFRMLRKQPEGRIPEDWVRFYAAEVLMALQYLHSIGFIYRDLKPENILLHATGHIMLTDFDLAAQAEVSAPEIHKRSSWSKFKHAFTGSHKGDHSDVTFRSTEPVLCRTSFVGTPEYIAPEVITGNGHTSAVDWWTFGVLIFEMTFGKTPYAGRTEQLTFAKIADEDERLRFPEIPVISKELRKLMKKLLEKQVKKRLGAKFGASEIMKMPFFEGVKWQLIRHAQPPYLPPLRDPLDTSAFMHVSPRDHDPDLDAEIPWAREAAPPIDAHENALLNQMMSDPPAIAGGGAEGGASAHPPGQRQRFLSLPQVSAPTTAPVTTPTAHVARDRFQSHASMRVPAANDPFAGFGHSVAYHHRSKSNGTSTVGAPRPVSVGNPNGDVPRPISVNGDVAPPSMTSPTVASIQTRLIRSHSDAMSPQSPGAFAAASAATAAVSRESRDSKPKRTAVLFYAALPMDLRGSQDFILSVFAVKESAASSEMAAQLPPGSRVAGSCGPFLVSRHREMELLLQLRDDFIVLGQNPEHLIWTGAASFSKVDFWLRAPFQPGTYQACVLLNLGEGSAHTLGFQVAVQ